jgi:hypothetical protein
MKMPLAGGTPSTLADAQINPTAIAVDDSSVYWANQCLEISQCSNTEATVVSGGTIMKIPLEGGTPSTLVMGQCDIDSIVVDSTSIYWTNSSEIMKLTPK